MNKHVSRLILGTLSGICAGSYIFGNYQIVTGQIDYPHPSLIVFLTMIIDFSLLLFVVLGGAMIVLAYLVDGCEFS